MNEMEEAIGLIENAIKEIAELKSMADAPKEVKQEYEDYLTQQEKENENG